MDHRLERNKFGSISKNNIIETKILNEIKICSLPLKMQCSKHCHTQSLTSECV